jgi:histidinol-phosphate aminotransferase
MSWRDAVRKGLRGIEAYHLPPLSCEVKLDANESPYKPPEALRAAIAEEAQHAALHRYPDSTCARLRAAVAGDLSQPGNRLVFGNGSDELIALTCSTFAEPRAGDAAARLTYPGPSFVVYRTAGLAAGMEVVEAPLGPDFEPRPDALATTIERARPTVVFIATPNNPTGTTWTADAFVDLFAQFPDTLFVIDEAYSLYARANFLPLVDQHENCAVLRTYSKIGLAGLRVGVLVAQPAVAAEVEKIRPPYNLGTLNQLAASIAIERFSLALLAHVDEVISERERLVRELSALDGVQVFPSGANLIMIRLAAATRVWEALSARSIAVRNFDRPGPLAGCLRITVGTPAENSRFLEAMREALAAAP